MIMGKQQGGHKNKTKLVQKEQSISFICKRLDVKICFGIETDIEFNLV